MVHLVFVREVCWSAASQQSDSCEQVHDIKRGVEKEKDLYATADKSPHIVRHRRLLCFLAECRRQQARLGWRNGHSEQMAGLAMVVATL